jgi:hypothetical protein
MRGVFHPGTPFDEQLRVDEESLRQVVEHNLEAGVHGQQGWETMRLTPNERVSFTAAVATVRSGLIEEPLVPGPILEVVAAWPNRIRIQATPVLDGDSFIAFPYDLFICDGEHQWECSTALGTWIKMQAPASLGDVSSRYGMTRLILPHVLFAEESPRGDRDSDPGILEILPEGAMVNQIGEFVDAYLVEPRTGFVTRIWHIDRKDSKWAIATEVKLENWLRRRRIDATEFQLPAMEERSRGLEV